MMKIFWSIITFALMLQAAASDIATSHQRRGDISSGVAHKRAAGVKRCNGRCGQPLCQGTGEGPGIQPFQLSYPPQGNDCLLCVANCGWIAGGGDPRNTIPGLDYDQASCCLVGCVRTGKCESGCSMCRQICNNVAPGVARQAQCWQDSGCGHCPNPYLSGANQNYVGDATALFFGNPPQASDGRCDSGCQEQLKLKQKQ